MLNPGVKMPNTGVQMPKAKVSNFQIHRIILAFKMPESGIYIAKIGVSKDKYFAQKVAF